MINVNVFSNEKAWSKKLKRKEFFFNKICKAFPKKYQFLGKKISFSLLLSNNKSIKKLNKEFRNKNKSTDVLSFPFSKQTKISKIRKLSSKIRTLETWSTYKETSEVQKDRHQCGDQNDESQHKNKTVGDQDLRSSAMTTANTSGNHRRCADP